MPMLSRKGPVTFLARPMRMLYRGICAGAARPVGDQQVIPALAEDHDRRFGVDGDVDRLSLRIQTFPGLRIQLDEADVAEVGTVCEPERTGRGIEKHARVDGIAVLDAIGPDDRTAVLPFVVRGLGIERLADQQADRGLGLRAGRGIVEEVLLTDPNHVRRPGIVAATRDDVRPWTPSRERLHQGAGPPPRPSVVRDQDRQAGAGPVGVVPCRRASRPSKDRGFRAAHRVPARERRAAGRLLQRGGAS